MGSNMVAIEGALKSGLDIVETRCVEGCHMLVLFTCHHSF